MVRDKRQIISRKGGSLRVLALLDGCALEDAGRAGKSCQEDLQVTNKPPRISAMVSTSLTKENV